MVITNKRKIAQRAAYLRDHAFSKERHFWHKDLGFNYRMTNLQAALGLAQTERVTEFVKKKIDIAKYYNSLLKDIKGITLPHNTKDIKNVYWMYAILIERNFGITRDRLRQELAKKGIETRTFFVPIHLQPIYSKICKGNFSVAEELCKKGMYLPSSLNLKKDEIEFIAKSIKNVY